MGSCLNIIRNRSLLPHFPDGKQKLSMTMKRIATLLLLSALPSQAVLISSTESSSPSFEWSAEDWVQLNFTNAGDEGRDTSDRFVNRDPDLYQGDIRVRMESNGTSSASAAIWGFPGGFNYTLIFNFLTGEVSFVSVYGTPAPFQVPRDVTFYNGITHTLTYDPETQEGSVRWSGTPVEPEPPGLPDMGTTLPLLGLGIGGLALLRRKA